MHQSEPDEISTGDLQPPPSKREPVFNLPMIILLFAAIFIAVRVVQDWVLDAQDNVAFILLSAVIPARYGELGGLVPYNFAAWYTPFSHAFVHGSWSHLLINLFWMLAFGSAIARRLSLPMFLFFSCLGAFCGFVLHLFTHLNEFTPMIGASGMVSAYMGAASRFVFTPKGPDFSSNISERKVMSLNQSFRNTSFVSFVGIWLLINLLFALQPMFVGGQEVSVAWQAHIGGFLFGLIALPWFDRR